MIMLITKQMSGGRSGVTESNAIENLSVMTLVMTLVMIILLIQEIPQTKWCGDPVLMNLGMAVWSGFIINYSDFPFSE
jgi:hypothetical protein